MRHFTPYYVPQEFTESHELLPSDPFMDALVAEFGLGLRFVSPEAGEHTHAVHRDDAALL